MHMGNKNNDKLINIAKLNQYMEKYVRRQKKKKIPNASVQQ